MLAVQFPVALRAPDEQIGEGSDDVCEEDDEDPDDFGISLVRFFAGAIDEYPEPEDECEERKEADQNED